MKARRKSSHKGENGSVLIVGGSEEYAGAPALVAQAALAVLRSGADLVHVAAPEKVAWAINAIAPDIITHKLKGRFLASLHKTEIKELAKKADVVVLGNGAGTKLQTKKLFKELIKLDKRFVIDADALKAVRLREVHDAVLTPHAKEYEALLKNSNLQDAPLQQVKQQLDNNILVLKSHRTKIVSKTKSATNTTGNAGMTKGGTGDVLAGIIAGLMAQGNAPFESAKIAAYVNGKAADKLYNKMGFGYIASDIVKEIPYALKKV